MPVLPKEKLIFALDYPRATDAGYAYDTLKDEVGLFKLGLELFMAKGPAVFEWLPPERTMLDLKLHDIPETVERTTSIIVAKGVKFFTLHTLQQAALERVVRACEGTGTAPVCVTVLTSLNSTDLIMLGAYDQKRPTESVATLMRALVSHAYNCGIRHFVCSAQEARMVRTLCYKGVVLITPGIRASGAEKHDQKRAATPKEALAAGADYLVVGRPIRDAPDPVRAAQEIVAEMAGLDPVPA